MKRHAALLLAVVMLLALAAPAAAKPPNCEETPWHPACGGANDEPAPAGTACSVLTDGHIAAVSDDFGFILTGDFACIDVSNVSPTGAWYITYDVTAGTLRELLVLVRDSFSPGDICNYGMRLRHVTSGSFTLEPNAADYVNSCGIEFAEMIGDTYHGEANENVQSPLAFLVFARGTKDLSVNIKVDYPNAATP